MTKTKSAIIDGVYDRVGGTKREISEVVDALFETMKQELESGGELKISGFGRFDVLNKASRIGRNPKTKQEMLIPNRKVIRYKISKVFKEELNT